MQLHSYLGNTNLEQQLYPVGIPHKMPQVMSTMRSLMAKILSSLWNIVLEFLLKRKMMAPPLITMPENMKIKMEMWVGVHVKAKLSTMVCIHGLELMVALSTDISACCIETYEYVMLLSVNQIMLIVNQNSGTPLFVKITVFFAILKL